MDDLQNIKVIGFDADDTLWINETFFREAELEFVKIVSEYASKEYALEALYEVEMANMAIYGYGIKAFTLSLIETACLLSNNNINALDVLGIVNIGKNMLDKPVILLDDIELVLKELSKKYRLIVATKGDLLDQERKLKKSGLIKYFHHIEVMSDKNTESYNALIHHLDIEPREFLMIGNSMKSDVLPVVELGGFGIHVPFHTTWQHEVVEHPQNHPRILEMEHVKKVLQYF